MIINYIEESITDKHLATIKAIIIKSDETKKEKKMEPRIESS